MAKFLIRISNFSLCKNIWLIRVQHQDCKIFCIIPSNRTSGLVTAKSEVQFQMENPTSINIISINWFSFICANIRMRVEIEISIMSGLTKHDSIVSIQFSSSILVSQLDGIPDSCVSLSTFLWY